MKIKTSPEWMKRDEREQRRSFGVHFFNRTVTSVLAVTRPANSGEFYRTAMIIFLLLLTSVIGQYNKCWKGDSNCPPCPNNSSESWKSHLWLNKNKEMIFSVEKAQSIIEQHDLDRNIIALEPLNNLHVTLNYFCCHTKEERKKIAELIRNIKWHETWIQFKYTSCNVDREDKIIYIHALADEFTQEYLLNLVKTIEKTITNAGIVIHNPRVQEFHSTLAKVTTGYTADHVVSLLWEEIDLYTQFMFDEFENNGERIRPVAEPNHSNSI